MNARGARAVLVALGAAVAGCATTGTPPPGGFVTRCKDIDLTNVSLEPTRLEKWTPDPKDKVGFLRVEYRWETNGDVYALGILYESFDVQSVSFIVGPIRGFPDSWTLDQPPPAGAKEDWGEFFHKLRKASEMARPGSLYCRAMGCPRPPDSPPPDLMGTASSGSSGGYAALITSPEQLYAQATQTRTTATDAGYSKTREERERIVKDLAKKTCHGVQAHLGKE
jgi:hypothetical protein